MPSTFWEVDEFVDEFGASVNDNNCNCTHKRMAVYLWQQLHCSYIKRLVKYYFIRLNFQAKYIVNQLLIVSPNFVLC